MIIQKYWKCQNQTGSAMNIARFLPPSASSLLLIFLSLLKGKEVALIAKESPEKASLCKTFFLTQRGNRIADDTLRNWVSEFFKARDLDIKFSDYRSPFLSFLISLFIAFLLDPFNLLILFLFPIYHFLPPSLSLSLSFSFILLLFCLFLFSFSFSLSFSLSHFLFFFHSSP